MEEKQNNNDSRVDPAYQESKLNLEDFKGDKNKYFTLFEISKYTPYSQEYLSLRARQGKLKAVKEGRDWMTTINWTKDYLKMRNGKNGKEEKALIVLPGMAVMKYSALVLVFFCLGVYAIFNFNGWQTKVKNNILLQASSVKQSFVNLSQTFKSDYKNKFEILGNNLDRTEVAATGGTKKLGNLITGSVGSIGEFTETVLSGSKNLAKKIAMAFSKKVNNFSEAIGTVDSKTDKIVFSQKKNFSNFYSQGKNGIISFFRGVTFSTGKTLTMATDIFFEGGKKTSNFANKEIRSFKKLKISVARSFSQIKKFSLIKPAKEIVQIISGSNNLIKEKTMAASNGIGDGLGQTIASGKKFIARLFFSAGKNLVYVNDKFFKLSAKSSDFVVIIFKSSNQKFVGLKNISSEGSLAVRNKFFDGMEILFSGSDKIMGSLSRSVSNGTKTVFSAPKLLWKIAGGFADNGWNKVSDKLSNGYLALLNYLIPERSFMPTPLINQERIVKKSDTGIVVLPVAGGSGISQNKYLLSKIEESFSDEVKVEPSEDGNAGIIKPIQPAVPGEEYLYMIVPVKPEVKK